jgi:hypothetical protein
LEDGEIGQVTLIGSSGTSISDSNGCPGNVGPLDLTRLSSSLMQGQRYTIQIERTTCGDFYVGILGAWIDYNRDGAWTSSELLFPFSQGIGSLSFSFTVPTTAYLGRTRMRIQLQEIGSTATSTIDPCTNFQWGDTKDYTINIIAGTSALEERIVAPTQVTNTCLPDFVAPLNGGLGTCAGSKNLGEYCVQTCNDGYRVRPGTTLTRECILDGYSVSTAICDALPIQSP